MRITDLYESFLTDKNDIIAWMNKSFIQFSRFKLKIEPDGLVYDGDLKLDYYTNEIIVPFKEVTGCFNSYETKISSLFGCPRIVGKYFSCSHAAITSLKYCPQSIGGDFYCRNVNLNTKEYRYALYCEIGGSFISDIDKIDNIINTYSGKDNRKYWPYAINLLCKIQL